MNITKSQLSKKISKELNLSLQDSILFINSFFDIKKKFLKKNNLKLSKFGRFSRKISPERIGRNPKTLEEYLIPKHSKISFKASKIIKSIIN